MWLEGVIEGVGRRPDWRAHSMCFVHPSFLLSQIPPFPPDLPRPHSCWGCLPSSETPLGPCIADIAKP